MSHCLDAWTVMEWLDGGEPATGRVNRLLGERPPPIMSWINLGEVAYQLRRMLGPQRASFVVELLRGSFTLDLPTPELVLEAAAIKADRQLGFADAFAAATARAHDAVLLTGDPDLIEGDPPWQVEDLRHAA
ncbi:MAG: PIN domain-containing protein [Actinomycetota bacterium]